MLQIPPEFILKTLQNAYKEYNSIEDNERKLKVYGFCDALEKLIYKFAPEHTQEIKEIQRRYNISKTINTDKIDLDEPTWMRNRS